MGAIAFLPRWSGQRGKAGSAPFHEGWKRAADTGEIDKGLLAEFERAGASDAWIRSYRHEPSLKRQQEMRQALLATARR